MTTTSTIDRAEKVKLAKIARLGIIARIEWGMLNGYTDTPAFKEKVEQLAYYNQMIADNS